jgi:hypothetical protein
MEDAPLGSDFSAETSTTLMSQALESEDLTFDKIEETEQWAEIIEPVTNDTLLDTVLAQLQALTTLCGIMTPDEGRGIAWTEEYSSKLLNRKIPEYVKGTVREHEVAFEKAKFLAAVAESNFRCRRIDFNTYARSIEEAFIDLGELVDIMKVPEEAVAKAEAYISFNSLLRKNKEHGQERAALAIRWKALTMSMDLLTAATKSPSVQNVSAIHILRGDVELLRFQLGQGDEPYDIAAKSANTLVKNAKTYYKGAAAIAEAAASPKEYQEAGVKSQIVESLMGDKGIFGGVNPPGVSTDDLWLAVADAAEEGLFTKEWFIREQAVYNAH